MSTTSELGKKAIEEGILHFGVKGMHWGVRKQESVSVQTNVDTGIVKRQTKVQTTGGQSHPAHPDAVTAAVQQQKLKKSGTAALSNQELRDLIARRQLESQVKVATSKKGQRFAQRQLENQGQQQIQKSVGKAAPHVFRRVRKGAAAAATTAALL